MTKADMLLDLLRDAYPDSNIPTNFHAANKLVKHLGLGYITIHACENDCILFWKGENSVCATTQFGYSIIMHYFKGLMILLYWK